MRYYPYLAFPLSPLSSSVERTEMSERMNEKKRRRERDRMREREGGGGEGDCLGGGKRVA